MAMRDVLWSLSLPALFFLTRRFIFARLRVAPEWLVLLSLLLPLVAVYVRRTLLGGSPAPATSGRRRKKLRPSAAAVDALECGERSAPSGERRSFVQWVNECARKHTRDRRHERDVLVLARYFHERRNADVSHVRSVELPQEVESIGDAAFVEGVVRETERGLLLERDADLECVLCGAACTRFQVTPNVFKTFILMNPCVQLCGSAECARMAQQELRKMVPRNESGK